MHLDCNAGRYGLPKCGRTARLTSCLLNSVASHDATNAQVLLSGSYAVFFAANLIPGRLDTKLGRPKREDMRFFTPAGWAFAIWAPIFLGEMLMSFSTFVPSILAPAGSDWMQKTAPYYAAACMSQVRQLHSNLLRVGSTRNVLPKSFTRSSTTRARPNPGVGPNPSCTSRRSGV